ncbi:hypothetical protein HOT49_gp079 [Erwinia phage vB_EamM_Alexandra]|uniref:Uncharacterized protein n=1 Tax=Erwinia phage vB_EamM_Alexandra TaxID=2201424 RepID=A0A2Z4QF69_9CAUD|nr:hypothetical protein HOT49_gp079 [Erwinia phage vB_EamM_Alexandra]AWY08356.1 hypothetical protein Alexandra_79 [Erwinia phage vB_EamM_Alexandra]
MRMLPATVNAMERNAYSALVQSATPTVFTAVANAILFYTGAMPTKAELNALIAEGTQLTSTNALYHRPGLLTTARVADYVGGVTGNKAAMTLNANNVPVLLASALNMRLNATYSDYRASYFKADATPTWCIVLGGSTTTINVQTGVTDVPAAFMAVCSVGDENSNADLKLVGGKVYNNSAAPADQSKAVIVNDLVLKFA